MTTKDERARRQGMSDHAAMADAQACCVPCKLCGGKAVITDAGTGAGYYIRCENSGTFRAAEGCMITDRRLGGWAYNVMDWWNRLHSAPDEKAIRHDERKRIIAGGCIHTRKAAEQDGDGDRADIVQWQTEQSQWFDATICEIVSEYAEWRDRQSPVTGAEAITVDYRNLLARCEKQLALKLGASPLLRELRAALSANAAEGGTANA